MSFTVSIPQTSCDINQVPHLSNQSYTFMMRQFVKVNKWPCELWDLLKSRGITCPVKSCSLGRPLSPGPSWPVKRKRRQRFWDTIKKRGTMIRGLNLSPRLGIRVGQRWLLVPMVKMFSFCTLHLPILPLCDVSFRVNAVQFLYNFVPLCLFNFYEAFTND